MSIANVQPSSVKNLAGCSSGRFYQEKCHFFCRQNKWTFSFFHQTDLNKILISLNCMRSNAWTILCVHVGRWFWQFRWISACNYGSSVGHGKTRLQLPHSVHSAFCLLRFLRLLDYYQNSVASSTVNWNVLSWTMWLVNILLCLCLNLMILWCVDVYQYFRKKLRTNFLIRMVMSF